MEKPQLVVYFRVSDFACPSPVKSTEKAEKAETKLPLRKNRNFLKRTQLQILAIMHNMPHVAEKTRIAVDHFLALYLRWRPSSVASTRETEDKF